MLKHILQFQIFLAISFNLNLESDKQRKFKKGKEFFNFPLKLTALDKRKL